MPRIGLISRKYGAKPRAATALSAVAPLKDHGSVAFVVPADPNLRSSFGDTSPQPHPSWLEVAEHMCERMPNFDSRLQGTTVLESNLDNGNTEALDTIASADTVLLLGCHHSDTPQRLKDALARANGRSSSSSGSESSGPPVAVLAHASSDDVMGLQRVDNFKLSGGNPLARVAGKRVPWTRAARGKRLLNQASMLLDRNSSEDLLYALFFVLGAYVVKDLELVKYTVNPTWEKGFANVLEFKKMATCCLPEIKAAISDPVSKEAIDMLNEVDLRDQVGSYRVIVSYETPLLEDFSLCILQQNNCFNCDAKIIENPKVPVMEEWRGAPLTSTAANSILVGHFDHPSSAILEQDAHQGDDHEDREVDRARPWSWKVVCGANPAYDAFPCQHQLFYPSEKKSSSLWYDPVFLVETVDGRRVWTKRHYRCTPRKALGSEGKQKGSTPGLWTFSTLDNGVASRELWTLVDAADDLSWCVLHYTGAAARAGTAYTGALLCSRDGSWPSELDPSADPTNADGKADGSALSGYARAEAAFAKCGLKMWELYGHGPPGQPTPEYQAMMYSEKTAADTVAAGEPTSPSSSGTELASDSPASRGSFMWSEEVMEWTRDGHPPPLEPIGDITVQAWRAAERAKIANESAEEAITAG